MVVSRWYGTSYFDITHPIISTIMTEVRPLFPTATRDDPSSISASGLRSESSTDNQSDISQQYGLFATTDYKQGDVILEESPIAVLSHLLEPSSTSQKSIVATTSSVSDLIKAQFKPTSFSDKPDKEGESKTKNNKVTPLTDLVLPKDMVDKLKSCSESIEVRIKKLRGMILAVATYATHPPSNDDKLKLFNLYHPSIDAEGSEEEANAVELAKIAVESCKLLAATDGSLFNIVNGNSETVLKLALIYSCNAFDGGRLYQKLSRVNHSCNPNAVVVEGGSSHNVSALKAACSISKGSEITISYLGKELFVGKPIRNRKLRVEKHFVCRCKRCTGNNAEEVLNDNAITKSVSLDLASCIPCPICHPRTKYLDEDIMFDEEDDNLQVSYAFAENGLTPEDRSLHCTTCGGVTSMGIEGSVRKKKEGMTIKYMTMAEDKVYNQIETNKFSEQEGDSAEQEVDRSLLQMATATCGARHWTTQILNLAIIEETLVNLQATLMTVDQEQDEMEEMFTDIAECADGIEKAFAYAKSLNMNLDPAHWLFDYVLGLARILVGLGDEKSQKYGAKWIERVEDYANKYENEGIRKVVSAVKNAWRRKRDAEKTENEASEREGDVSQTEAKRRKID